MSTTPADLFVGTAGWSYPDWKGTVYPAGPPARFDPLRYLAGFLDVIEINSTFYRPPSAGSAERWARTTGDLPRFRFTAKLFQGFTHESPERWDPAEIRAFEDGLRPLVDSRRLAAVLAQFPFFFAATRANLLHLKRIAETFRTAPLVLEVRHASFLEEKILQIVRGLGFSFCNVDQPRSGTSIPAGARVTGPIGYLRLHGRNADAWFAKGAGRDEKYDYLYSVAELETFAPIVQELRQRTEQVFVVTNNHYLGKGPANALELKGLLTGRPVAVPPDLVRTYPRLKQLEQEAAAP